MPEFRTCIITKSIKKLLEVRKNNQFKLNLYEEFN